MRTSTPKIVNVRPKQDGASIHVLPTSITEKSRYIRESFSEELQHALHNHPDMAGYVVVTWGEDGKSTPFWKVDMVISPIPFRLIPAYIHDRMQEEICRHSAREVANDVIDERLL